MTPRERAHAAVCCEGELADGVDLDHDDICDAVTAALKQTRDEALNQIETALIDKHGEHGVICVGVVYEAIAALRRRP